VKSIKLLLFFSLFLLCSCKGKSSTYDKQHLWKIKLPNETIIIEAYACFALTSGKWGQGKAPIYHIKCVSSHWLNPDKTQTTVFDGLAEYFIKIDAEKKEENYENS